MRLSAFSSTSAPPEEYTRARQSLQSRLSSSLRAAMASLVGNIENADLLLVSADGKKIPAHECILRARAPGFYARHVEATLTAMNRQNNHNNALTEVAIGDIDSAGLEFFIHSVYTEDEIALFPSADNEERGDTGSRQSRRSFQMDDSTNDFDDFRSDMEDDSHRDEEGHFTPPSTSHPTQHSQRSSTDTLSRQPSLPFTQQTLQYPGMTSFRDLASASPLNASVYSLGGRSEVGPDIPEEDEEGANTDRERRSSSRNEVGMSKFIRIDSSKESSRTLSPTVSPTKRQKAIFPLFIGLGEESDEKPYGIRGRAMMAKRLSVASLTSLTSIDLMTSSDVQLEPGEKHPSCRLAGDLLAMYLQNVDTDVVVHTQNGDLFAHKCILSALSPFFRQQLKKSPKIEMKGYSKSTVHFLLTFLYGGVTCIPDEVDVWEVVSLATHLNLKHLVEVVIMHVKMTKCHWFHRPCSSCVSASFDILPQLHSIRCLRPLYDEILAWQSRHFSRIWKGRVFLHLNDKWQRECFEALIASLDDESVIDIILGCERLQSSLPRVRSEGAMNVLHYVNEVLEMSLQFLTSSFHLVVTSRSFAAQGKGLALNVGLLEELLPPIIHSLSADTAIKSFIGLLELKECMMEGGEERDENEQFGIEEKSPRFVALLHRLIDVVDKHLLHFAASVVTAESFVLLSAEEQQRIRETGIFVEMREPKCTPPRLSSFYRTYKRSSSAGVQPMSGASIVQAKKMTPPDRQVVKAVEAEPNPLPPPSTSKAVEEPKEEPMVVVEEKKEKKKEEPVKTEKKKEEKEEKREEKKVTPSHSPPSNLPVQSDPPPTETKPPPSTAKSTHTSSPSTSSTRTADNKGTSQPSSSKTSTSHPPSTTATRPKAIETDEGGRLERQQTHTIMVASDATKAAAAAHLPGPHKAAEKPKSVVKPMPQESLAKEKSLPRVTAQSTPAATTSSTKAAPAPLRSAIPRKSTVATRASSTGPPSTPATVTPSTRRIAAAEGSKAAPRSPRNARKGVAN